MNDLPVTRVTIPVSWKVAVDSVAGSRCSACAAGKMAFTLEPSMIAWNSSSCSSLDMITDPETKHMSSSA